MKLNMDPSTSRKIIVPLPANSSRATQIEKAIKQEGTSVESITSMSEQGSRPRFRQESIEELHSLPFNAKLNVRNGNAKTRLSEQQYSGSARGLITPMNHSDTGRIDAQNNRSYSRPSQEPLSQARTDEPPNHPIQYPHRQRMDAFVANNPFQPSVSRDRRRRHLGLLRRLHQDISFDDINIAATPSSQHRYYSAPPPAQLSRRSPAPPIVIHHSTSNSLHMLPSRPIASPRHSVSDGMEMVDETVQVSVPADHHSATTGGDSPSEDEYDSEMEIPSGYISRRPLHRQSHRPAVPHATSDQNGEPHVVNGDTQKPSQPVKEHPNSAPPTDSRTAVDLETNVRQAPPAPVQTGNDHYDRDPEDEKQDIPGADIADESTLSSDIFEFVSVTVPGQLYLYILLCLPTLYFSRVARIFEEANLSLPEIKKMALETASEGKNATNLHYQYMTIDPSSIPPAYLSLKITWEAFIDSTLREWKTHNIISVLLLSAILTVLQIPGAATDPVTRYSALYSLICALFSLLYGCVCIIRFGTMRKTYKAAEWALEAQNTATSIWWNVFILLAMPAIWLAWSILLYIICIMSYVWRSGVDESSSPNNSISSGAELAVRIGITVILFLGIVYGALIIKTFTRYGDDMDKKWSQRIDGWIMENAATGYYPEIVQQNM